MTRRAREQAVASDARRPWIAALACACLVGAAGLAVATSAERPDRGAEPAPGRATEGEVHAAAASARVFLDDYLAWLGGRRAPQRIRAASKALRELLAADLVRPSRAARRRRPRIAELHTQLTGPRSGRAVARVLEGTDTPFRVELDLERARDGWEVIDAGP